jgi:hypothetical protein
MLVKPFTLQVAEVYKVCWKGIQVKTKEVYFQRRIAPHHSVGFKHLLNQLSVFGRSVVAQKVVNNQSECFSRFLLSSFKDLIKIPIIHKLLYLTTDEDPYFYLCIVDPWIFLLQIPKTFCHFGSWPSQNFSSVQAWCEVEVELFSVDIEMDDLQCSFA